METSFRLYNKYDSSYFNLIEGNKELQQTKGLGLLLSKSPIALKAFLTIPTLKNKIGKIDLNKVERLIVNCELPSKQEAVNDLRADIILRFYANKKPFKAFLIEAKSVNKSTSVISASRQLKNYIDQKCFPELDEFGNECYGITLTKDSSPTKDPQLIAITWSEVIEAFYKARRISTNDNLLSDYTNFIMSINVGMQFYEKEVYSIPTSPWSKQAIENFGVYECPTTGPYVMRYKPLFITFRGSDGGVMERLHKVEQTIILNFAKDLAAFLEDDSYDETMRKIVKAYADFLLSINMWPELPDDEKQVLILSKQSIELKNRPRPKRNNSFRAYYTLADLMNNEICGMPQEENQ